MEMLPDDWRGSGWGSVMADGGGKPRWGVLILREALSDIGGREADWVEGEGWEERGCCVGEYT